MAADPSKSISPEYIDRTVEAVLDASSEVDLARVRLESLQQGKDEKITELLEKVRECGLPEDKKFTVVAILRARNATKPEIEADITALEFIDQNIRSHRGEVVLWLTEDRQSHQHDYIRPHQIKAFEYLNIGLLATNASLRTERGSRLSIPLQNSNTFTVQHDERLSDNPFHNMFIGGTAIHVPPRVIEFDMPPGKPDGFPILIGNAAIESAIEESDPSTRSYLRSIVDGVSNRFAS